MSTWFFIYRHVYILSLCLTNCACAIWVLVYYARILTDFASIILFSRITCTYHQHELLVLNRDYEPRNQLVYFFQRLEVVDNEESGWENWALLHMAWNCMEKDRLNRAHYSVKVLITCPYNPPIGAITKIWKGGALPSHMLSQDLKSNIGIA